MSHETVRLIIEVELNPPMWDVDELRSMSDTEIVSLFMEDVIGCLDGAEWTVLRGLGTEQ